MTIPPITPPSGEPPRPQGPATGSIPPPVYGAFYGQPTYQPPASKAMAGWALGLSILNCVAVGVFVAIGLAIAVLVKGQRDGRDHGKGMAIAALIISALWIIAFVVFVVLAVTGKIEIDDSVRDGTGELTDEQEISLTSLRVGDCIGLGEISEMMDEAQYDVTAVPCSQAHSGELYHLFELADGDYPGHDEVIRLAETGCFDAFRGYVGISPNRSRIGVTYLYPESVGWRIANDREVFCFLVEFDESTTDSLKGAKR